MLFSLPLGDFERIRHRVFSYPWLSLFGCSLYSRDCLTNDFDLSLPSFLSVLLLSQPSFLEASH
ncbi:hypothetical protein RchiOBHm_Chr7g0205191 [Rosa chinensis]|uniref:Uncharacterized protein n=1 Tax=Rosa chinensis TaxID=74649 RepID=A0A2P6P8W9_ROSCH|nr:hypothetical protein RchiOBHm_Chr7g0205191 [Rosa chinensis]